MCSKFAIGLPVLILALLTLLPAAPVHAAPGDLYVQINLENGTDGCSILRVEPDGTLSEWVSNGQILAVTGEADADCDDTGLAVAFDGTLYFSEDTSDSLLRVTPTGVVSLFVSEATLTAATGDSSSDIDSGLIVGSDGNIYAADDDCDCVIRITPAGVVSVVVTEAEIETATGGGADLEGGLGRNDAGTLFITEDDTDQIVVVPAGGTASVLTSEADILAATGHGFADLDVGAELDGAFFVLDDEDEDSLLRIDPFTGNVTLVAQGALATATGVPADLEGGIATESGGDLFIGDHGTDLGGEDRANIVRVTRAGAASIFVSDAEIQSFYSALYPGFDAELEGSMDFQPTPPPAVVEIPTLDGWGQGLLVLLLLGLGVGVLRRLTP
jgi:hypothetical protein